MPYLIDPPSPFEPLAEWEEFLASLLRDDQTDEDIIHAVQMARRIIAEKKAEASKPPR